MPVVIVGVVLLVLWLIAQIYNLIDEVFYYRAKTFFCLL